MDTQHSFDDEGAYTLLSTGKAPERTISPDDVGHYLVAVEGAEPGKLVEIGAEPVTIGRDARQSFAFPADSEVSRLHARVAFVDGQVMLEDLGSTNGTFVNAQRIRTPVTLREGTVLRVGHQILKYERRSRREVERARELAKDLARATKYVHSMLPPPLEEGPVRAQWSFVPSAQLGGDAFGYYWLDPDTFIFYLMDVSGHGAGSAMHSVSVLNVLRQRALPHVDFARPDEVLASLNERFTMESHNGLYFTIWYGVYRPADRTLTYASAGHNPSYLVPPTRDHAEALGVPGFMIGAVSGNHYQVQEATIPAGSTLYVFSDGVYEIVTHDQQQWTLSDIVPRFLEPAIPGVPEPERIYQIVRRAARPGLLDDDFSLLAVTFE
jgi:serine phosphatase RsbU (regulator of sigma subunit)